MTRFYFEVYFTAVLNLILLVCICFQVVFFRTFYADRKYQRPLRMVAFLTQNVVDVFGVSGIKLCLIDNACSNRSCKARVATGKHCQHTAKVSHSNSPPLIPKTLTLVLLKALIRTNDNRGFIFKLPFNGAGFAFGDELPLLLKALIRTND